MHGLVDFSENPNPENLGVVGSLVRSAWEDLQENRKRILAGRNQHVLEPRPDMDAPRLLTREEEEKLRKARNSQPRPAFGKGNGGNFATGSNQYFANFANQGGFRNSRPRSSSRQGKGNKGKGGKANNTFLKDRKVPLPLTQILMHFAIPNLLLIWIFRR